MGQSDNDLDIVISPLQDGVFNVEIIYWHTRRKPDAKGVRRISSYTAYNWKTDCKEIISLAKRKRTKVFYSQIRVLCREYGERTFEKIE